MELKLIEKEEEAKFKIKRKIDYRCFTV